jgi:hypothetical protein
MLRVPGQKLRHYGRPACSQQICMYKYVCMQGVGQDSSVPWTATSKTTVLRQQVYRLSHRGSRQDGSTEDNSCVLICETCCSGWLKLSADRSTIGIAPPYIFCCYPFVVIFCFVLFCFDGGGPIFWLHLSPQSQTRYWSRRASFTAEQKRRICSDSAYSYFVLRQKTVTAVIKTRDPGHPGR